MSTAPLRLVVINSSLREGRFGPVVAKWLLSRTAQRDDMDVDYLDIADHPLPLRLSQEPSAEVREELAKVSPRLARADAFVVVTPEYNHSFPASLKNLIDWHYTQWQAKPIGFVSYGGLAGGLRAVEQLRPVFAELHAVTVRDVVSFHLAWEQFDQDGELTDGAAATAAAKTMLDQLAWWGSALRNARQEQPYSQ